MNQPAEKLNPMSKLKLKLLPPVEQEEITQDKIYNFYSDLIKIFATAN